MVGKYYFFFLVIIIFLPLFSFSAGVFFCWNLYGSAVVLAVAVVWPAIYKKVSLKVRLPAAGVLSNFTLESV